MEKTSPAFATVLFSPIEETITEQPKEEIEATPESLKEAAASIIEAPKKEEKVDELSPAAKFANSYKETDKILPEDLEIPPDLDWDGLKSLLREQSKKEALLDMDEDIQAREVQWEEHLKEKGYTEEQLQYASHLASGGNEQLVSRAAQLNMLATAKPETDEDKEAIIRVRYRLENTPEKMIDAYVERDLGTSEALDQAVQEAQEFIAQTRDQELQADRERAEAVRQQQAERLANERSAFERVIDGGFAGVKLTKKEADDLKEFMFTPKHFRDIDTPTGRKRVAETTESKAFIDMTPEDRVLLAYYMKGGLKNLVSTIEKKGADKFLQALERPEENPGDQTVLRKLPTNIIKVPF